MSGITGVFAAFLLKESLCAVSVRLRGEGDEHRCVAVQLPCTYCHSGALPWSWVSSEP